MSSSQQKQVIYPDEDLKALNFVRRSILRKNEVIYQLQEQLKQMQEEVLMWKRKFHAQEKQFGHFSPHSQDMQGHDDVGNPHENNRARKARIKAEVIHNDEEFGHEEKRAAGESSSMESMNSISRVGHENYVEMEPTEDPYSQQPEFEEPRDIVQYDDSGLSHGPLKVTDHPGLNSASPGHHSEAVCSLEATLHQQDGSGADSAGVSVEVNCIRPGPEPATAARPVFPTDACGYRSPYSVAVRAYNLKQLYACGVEACGFRTSGRYSMIRHMRTHTGEKPFQCPVEGCPYRAAQSSSVSVHVLRKHKGEKPFACAASGCRYRAFERGALTRHMRTHTGEKRHHCPVEGCGYRAAERQIVKRHMWVHRQKNGD